MDLGRDEGIRPGSSPETLAGLKPSFRPDGTITPGNASPLNDGASALLIGSEAAADRIGLTPSPGSRGAASAPPSRSGSGPPRSRLPTGRSPGPASTWPDVAHVELNEAFAVQSLACVDALAD